MKQCSVRGCASPARSYSPLCSRHRHAQGRNGHPQQLAIKAADLAPFVALIAKRQAENEGSKAWDILRSRWAHIVDQAQAYLAMVESGKAYQRHQEKAAQLILGVSRAASADCVIRHAMAVGLHFEARPDSYHGDLAKPFQMARRVLRLAPMSVGRYWDNKTKKSRTVQRDIPPRALAVVAHQLNEAFGFAAKQLHEVEVNRVPPAEVERRELAAALGSLKA